MVDARMQHRVTTLAALDALYDAPLDTSLGKERASLNEPYRRLIEASPFVVIASYGPDGLDASPRGDKPGFVRIIDDGTLAIPDRRGNNRLDTLRNLLTCPRVGLLFMIPGLNETLRVNGRAYLSIEPELLTSFVVNDCSPTTAIVIAIDTLYFQCARALKRSHLWDPGSRDGIKGLPSAGSLIRSAIADFDADGYDAVLQERQNKTLW